MLTFIKTNYHIGDSIDITCSEGTITGEIEYVNSKYIVLRQPNGKICGIAADDVRTFTAPNPVAFEPQSKPVTLAPVYDELTDSTTATAETAESNDEATNKDTPETAEAPDEVAEGKSRIKLTDDVPSVPEPKVVGHIDLDSIDPQHNRRRYFTHNDEDESKEAASDTESASDSENDPFISACGRITYYNPEKRFGFLHDFASDTDLYFYGQQIADPDLYSVLGKGTKVAYTIGRNNQGPMATCLHLPRPLSDLYALAEEAADVNHYHTAKALLERVLEIDADHKEAKALLDELEHTAPEPRRAPFSPTPYGRERSYGTEPRSYNQERTYDSARSYGNERSYGSNNGYNYGSNGYGNSYNGYKNVNNGFNGNKGYTPGRQHTDDNSNSAATYAPTFVYAQAKRAFLAKKYDEAEQLYLKAIDNDEKAESCVKDLITLYVSRYKQADTDEAKNEAIGKSEELLQKYGQLLSKSLTTKQFLALNYYLPIQQYDKFLAMVDNILTDPQVANAPQRKVFFLWQKGIALNKLNRSDEALALAEEALEWAPRSRQLINLRDFILHPELREAAAAASETAGEDAENAGAADNAEVNN